MSEQALRYNAGKPPIHYLLTAPNAVQHLATVFDYGAKKYAPDNWKKGLPTRQLVDSLLRHLTSYMNGNDYDAESGCAEVAHILWNAFVLAEQFGNQQWDDRPKGEK